MKTYYTYLWLREKDGTFPVGTPYYAGKGTHDRAFRKEEHRCNPPKDKAFILLQEFLDEAAALEAEKFLVAFYGRIDLGTGCLRNLTNGGDKPPSWKGRHHSLETRMKMSLSKKGNRGGSGTKGQKRQDLADYNRTRINPVIGKRWKWSEEQKQFIKSRVRDNKGRWINERQSQNS